MWAFFLLSTWILGGICSEVSCPHHCQCYLDEGLRTANCSQSALTTSHGHLQQSEVDVLNVRPHYNGFRARLSSRGFKNFKNIKFLNLSNTSITFIPDEVFYGLDFIISIDLSYNKIKHVNGGVFKQLSTLGTLSLRGNPLMVMHSDFIVSKSVRKLDLGYCGLRYLPPGMFQHVPNLALLFLDGNFIQTLDRHNVPPGVSYLNLANNMIINVPTDVLHKMSSLTRIDLSGNPIRCTCQLLLLQDTLSDQGRIFENDILCSGPRQFYGQRLSNINENDLCNLEFMKKERYMNSIKHFRDRDVRSYRKENMIKPLPTDDSFDIQGDQPHISDELAPNHDSEVMFSNDDTRSLGTHMALNSFTMHYPPSNPIDLSDENNKLSVDKQNLPVATDSDPSSTEVEVISSEKENSPLDLLALHGNDDAVNHLISHNETAANDLESVEDFNESSPQMDQLVTNTENTAEFAEEETEKSTEGADDLFDSPKEEELDEESSLLPTDHTDELLGDHEGNTEPSIIHDTEELTNASSHETLSQIHQSSNTTYDLHDVEEIGETPHNFTSEPMLSSKYTNADEHDLTNEYDAASISEVDKIFENDARTTQNPNLDSYTWPSSDVTDYSYYDAQHDYSSVDPSQNNVTDEGSHHPVLTTAVYSTDDKSTTESAVPSSASSVDLEEGSGFGGDSSEADEETTTVKWLEEQENDTSIENYSVENVSQVFNVSSEEIDRLSHYAAENVSSTETSVTDEELTTLLPEVSSASSSDEAEKQSTTDESTTEDLDITTVIVPSEESTAGEDTLSSGASPSYSPTPEDIEEITTDEPSSSTEASSSSVPLIPYVETSPETADEETTTGHHESSTEPSVIAVFSSDDEISSSTTPGSEITPELVHTETESSTTATEVEVVSRTIYADEKENIVLDPTREEVSKNNDGDGGPDIAMIGIIAAIVLIILIILLISMAVACRKTNRPKNKVRLPADPEANLGTEMQDMLLPKPPENGVKVVPKNYTNGTNAATANGKNQTEPKEEEIPVLSAVEPDTPMHDAVGSDAEDNEDPPVAATDWEPKPEPIETVTARLTMLARPQTPVFIPKTLN